jgi:phage tail protein X
VSPYRDEINVRPARSLVGLSAVALAASALLVPTSATAEPQDPASVAEAPGASQGRGAATTARAPRISQAEVVRRAAAAPAVEDPLVLPDSYPSQPALRFYRDNPDDAADTAELLTHPDLAPQLTEWMSESNRISTQVVGQSELGRDLYLVTVTAPERPEDTAQQAEWKELIKNDPEAAGANAELLSQYKTPVYFSANIQGNEWEGTDALMQYIEYLLDAPQSEVGSILRNNRLYFSLSLNPDARVAGTRASSLGFDPNRDMITTATAEATSYIRTVQAVQPIYAADLHGYTRVLQIEPTGPPHGSNYEYDLYLPHNYALALKVEQDVVDAAIPGNTYYNVVTGAVVTENTGPDTAHIKIPYRDTPTGWDDFPPIFSAQYAAFFGAATSTVELPLQRGAPGGRQTPERAAINVAVGVQTVRSMVDYMNDPVAAREMLANQIEVFRRGVAGEPKTSLTLDTIADVPGPDQWKPLWDVADDQEPTVLPRAYVIPVGDDQRSASDASALVRQLLLEGVEVGTLDAAATVDGTTYPAGSYVVDMRQPLRGLANSLLDLGDDISDKVQFMYDISAWSYSYLWGATVDKVGLVSDPSLGATTPVTVPAPVGGVAEGDYLTLDVAGVAEVRTVNRLLDEDVDVSLLPDGSVVVGPDGRAAAEQAAADLDVAFEAASADDLAALADEDTRGLADADVAYVGNQDDRVSLTELGFTDLTQVTAAALNANPALLDDIEVLWIGTSLTLAEGSAGRTAVQAFVDGGGALLGRTNQAFTVARTYGLVTGNVVSGNGDGNGIVDVDTAPGSVLAPYAQDEAFVYPAYWFTDLGAGTDVVQSYGADPLLAGHWRPGTSQGNPLPNGPANAAGQAAVVSAEVASGARTVVFGTSVFFRTHPKGGMSQAGRAILWAAPAGDGVAAPVEAPPTTLEVAAVSDTVYPASPSIGVTATSEAGVPSGTVEILLGEEVVGEADLVDGSATVTLDQQVPGVYEAVARYVPDSEDFAPATSEAVTFDVAKATAQVGLRVKQVAKAGRAGKGTVRVTTTLRVPDLPSTGTVLLKEGKKTLRTFTVTADSGVRRITVKLTRGEHTLRVVHPATPLVASAVSPRVSLRVR